MTDPCNFDDEQREVLAYVRALRARLAPKLDQCALSFANLRVLDAKLAAVERAAAPPPASQTEASLARPVEDEVSEPAEPDGAVEPNASAEEQQGS